MSGKNSRFRRLVNLLLSGGKLKVEKSYSVFKYGAIF